MNIAVAFGIVFMTLVASGAENIAIVKNVTGNVQAKRSGVYKTVKAGEFLEEGDVILVGEKSSTGVSFNDGTVIALGPKSVFALNRYRFKPASDEYDFDVTLKQGNAIVETGKMGKLAPQKVRFKVPQGYIGIRGTRFIVDIEE